ncbi:MAG: hypothetical protein K8U03_06440 [Planctomycetia bacterium]|nr:hypothetical protein [Planctomycetia bacterium]
MNQYFARLLGYGPEESIRDLTITTAAPWAESAPLVVLSACLCAAVFGIWFYAKYQPLKSRRVQYSLAVARAAILCLIILFLAEPTLEVRVTTHPKPWLWLLIDGSASMAIEDAPQTIDATGSPTTPEAAARKPRIELVKDAFRNADKKVLSRLADKFRLRAFTFDRPGEVRPLLAGEEADQDRLDPEKLAAQLTAEGQVTALGDAFNDLRERYASQHPAGVVVFSDFNKNAGLAPTDTGARLGAPLYCVGVGPASALDVAVDLQAPLLMKKGEQAELKATVRREGTAGGPGRDIVVKLTAHAIGTNETPRLIGEQRAQAGSDVVELSFPYAPQETGRFEFVAEIEAQPGETIVENNVSRREVNIRDDFLHLTFVDYEPNWEWRFIKEVFHRDRLVGMRGFRTFLRSADPKVRQTNELFLSSLTPPRGEFFVNDVIFLGDMPATSLSTRYCEMVKEFVDKFGGGLVILSGPNFGPGELASTPLADLLPVRVIPGGKFVDSGKQGFLPRLTAGAAEYDFMQLSADPLENRNLWNRLGPLEWFQPVAGVHDQGRVLLEHPTAKCADGRTPQPILAARRYGKGEVVYIAMNETWRLRREYGEAYYRKFWGQMIHRLGLSHALGNQKRFVVRTDRRQYQSGERVTATVEAYDQNYEPLNLAKLQPVLTQLKGELILPGAGPAGASPTAAKNSSPRSQIRLAQFREGEFQTEFDVQEAGEYVIRVQDPLSNEQVDAGFRVANVSAERRSPVRDVVLEQQLSSLRSERLGISGKRIELADFERLPEEIFIPNETESYPERIALWNTWGAFLLVVLLMLVEWFVRKWVHLP